MKAFNLIGKEEYLFDDNTTALWAVCYAYCEESNLLSALFSSAQTGKFLEFADTLPVTRGKKSIACGDWAAIDEDLQEEIRPGAPLLKALPTLRYTVQREFCGYPGARYVARYCGEWLGQSIYQRRAIAIAHDHRKEFCARAGIAYEVRT